MLKFSQFLLSENVNVGQKVHYQGNVSEHAYHKALLKYSSLRKDGVSHEDALNSITDTKSPSITTDHSDLKDAVSKIGKAETNKIIKNSLHSAKHFIQHIHEHYGEYNDKQITKYVKHFIKNTKKLNPEHSVYIIAFSTEEERHL